MTTSNTRPISTWNDYKAWVTKIVKNKMSFYCRGQVKEEWKLQTTFHRLAIRNKITLQQYLDTIIPEIHYHICAIQNEIIDLKKEQELGAFLALLQHHGFPTPLLDWTLSPYIAAYFAFREVDEMNPQSDRIKIFVFDYIEWTNSFKQPLDLRETKTNYVSVLRPYAKYNPRIIPQQAVFTITNVDDMGKYITSCEKNVNKTFLYTATLPTKEKIEVMRELNLMGINEMTLFPSIDGICRALKCQFFSPDDVGLTPSEVKAQLDYLKSYKGYSLLGNKSKNP